MDSILRKLEASQDAQGRISHFSAKFEEALTTPNLDKVTELFSFFASQFQLVFVDMLNTTTATDYQSLYNLFIRLTSSEASILVGNLAVESYQEGHKTNKRKITMSGRSHMVIGITTKEERFSQLVITHNEYRLKDVSATDLKFYHISIRVLKREYLSRVQVEGGMMSDSD